VTWNGSASVKAKLGIVEMDQVAPVSPIDGTSTPFDKSTDRVDTTNSSARSSAATNGVRRVGQIECFVGWIGWNDTRTISSAGSTWTGLVQLSGGSSNLGIGIERKLAEVTNVAGGNGIARFTMSASGTQPASVACLAFFRDGVITSNDNDGYLDNIEGVITTYTTDMSAYGGEFLYRSSSSAPLGGTGASNTARTYSYLPRYFKPAAATIGPTFSLSMISAGGFDDASGYVGFYGYVHKTEVFGTTLDSSDDFLTGNYAIYNGVGMTVSGLHTFSGLAYADYINPTGVTTVQWTSEGDTQGTQSNVYTVLGDHTNGTPAYIVLSLTYPSSAVPTRNLLGVGI
jgi:hypothetical protein